MAIPVLRASKAVYDKLSDEEENNMAQEDMIAPNAPGMEDEFGGYEEMKDGIKYNQEMGDDPRRPREETNEKRAFWVAGLLGISTVAAAVLLRNPTIMSRVSSAGTGASEFVKGLAGAPIVKQAVETAKKITGMAGAAATNVGQKAAGYGRQAYEGAQRMNPYR